MTGNHTGLTQKQIADREQFRRYAEAALQGLVALPFSEELSDMTVRDMSEYAFDYAKAMMLAECQAFAEFELMALQSMIDERNASDDAKQTNEN